MTENQERKIATPEEIDEIAKEVFSQGETCICPACGHTCTSVKCKVVCSNPKCRCLVYTCCEP